MYVGHYNQNKQNMSLAMFNNTDYCIVHVHCCIVHVVPFILFSGDKDEKEGKKKKEEKPPAVSFAQLVISCYC